MKKIIAFALAAIMAFSLASTAFAEEQPKVIEIDFSDETFQQEYAPELVGPYYEFTYQEDGIEVKPQATTLQYVEDYLQISGAAKFFSITATNRKIVDVTIHLKGIQSGSNTLYFGFQKNTTVVPGSDPVAFNSNYTITCDDELTSLVNKTDKEYLDSDEGYSSLRMTSTYSSTDVFITKVEITYFGAEEETTTAAPETSAPETTAPETTAPETTAPETTVPESTEPDVTTAAPTTAAPTTAAATTSPQTGDQAYAGIWIAISVLAAIGLATTFVLIKKENK